MSKLTLVLVELQKSYLHENRSEFRQEFNGHGPGHVTRGRHVSRTFFGFLKATKVACLISLIFELQKSYLHVNRSEFCQEFNGHGPGHVTRDRHVSRTFFRFVKAIKVACLISLILGLQKSYLHVNRSEFR